MFLSPTKALCIVWIGGADFKHSKKVYSNSCDICDIVVPVDVLPHPELLKLAAFKAE